MPVVIHKAQIMNVLLIFYALQQGKFFGLLKILQTTFVSHILKLLYLQR